MGEVLSCWRSKWCRWVRIGCRWTVKRVDLVVAIRSMIVIRVGELSPRGETCNYLDA